MLLTCLLSKLEDRKNVLNLTILKVPTKKKKQLGKEEEQGVRTNLHFFLSLIMNIYYIYYNLINFYAIFCY